MYLKANILQRYYRCYCIGLATYIVVHIVNIGSHTLLMTGLVFFWSRAGLQTMVQVLILEPLVLVL